MNAWELLKTGVEWCGVLLLVVVSLPLLAVVAFVLRAAVIGVVLLGLAGVIVMYCVYPPIRRWANEVGRLGGEERSVKESR
jgi:hypothetical protein